MTIEQAIVKAIEGGYVIPSGPFTLAAKGSARANCGFKLTETGSSAIVSIADIFLDPLFWSSLGKALKWQTYEKSTHGQKMMNRGMADQWLREWHDFIGHLAAGKSAEDFFEQLTEPIGE